MPRYFFHLRRNGRLESDPDGVQCPSVHAARREAMRTAREILSHAGGRPGHIFNLGHGILPDTDPDAVKFVVDHVHSYQKRA